MNARTHEQMQNTKHARRRQHSSLKFQKYKELIILRFIPLFILLRRSQVHQEIFLKTPLRLIPCCVLFDEITKYYNLRCGWRLKKNRNPT